MPIPKTSRLSVDCGKSASTLRLLLPIFSQLKQATFIGSESLFSRPLDIYQKIYKRQNLSFDLQKHIYKLAVKSKLEHISLIIQQVLNLSVDYYFIYHFLKKILLLKLII